MNIEATRKIDRVIGESKQLFIEVASNNNELRVDLKNSLPSIRIPRLLELILEMVGTHATTQSSTVFIGNDGSRILFDTKLAASGSRNTMFPEEVPLRISKMALCALIMMYCECDIRELPAFIDRKVFADEFLTLCEITSYLPPRNMRPVFLDFIVNEMFKGDQATSDFMAEHFPRMFQAGIHTRAIDKGDIAKVAKSAEKYMDNYNSQQIRWPWT